MARFFYDGELPFKINADIIGCAAAIGAGGNTHFGRKVLIKAIACADGDGLLCAVRGRSLISDCTALPVPSRALVSSRRPTSTRVMTTPTDSKYGSREPSGNTHGAMQVTSEYR